MISLYLDTSSSFLYAGLVKDGKLLKDIKKKYDKDLSKEALPEVISLIDDSNISKNEINKIFVVTGPGSFTGVRIGVTIAKTYAWAKQIDIIKVSGLTAMAISYKGEKDKIMPLIDARRGYVFGALYDKTLNPIIMDQYIELRILEEKSINEDYEIISNDNLTTTKNIVPYSPDIAKIVEFYQDKSSVNAHLLNPEYLKKTEAEERCGL